MATLKAHKYGCTLVYTYRTVQQSHAGVIHLIRCSFSITAVCASVLRVKCMYACITRPVSMRVSVCLSLHVSQCVQSISCLYMFPQLCVLMSGCCITWYLCVCTGMSHAFISTCLGANILLSQVVCVYAYAVMLLLLSYQSAVNLKFNFQWIIYPCRSLGTCTGHGSENI